MSANLPNVDRTIIATGYNCHVKVGTSSTDTEMKKIAMVASFQATEDFQVQEAVCLGNLGPISLDPQGYTCSITLDGFLPAKGVLNGEVQSAEGGGEAIMDHVPDRKVFMDADNVDKLPKIGYIGFYNKKENDTLIAGFEGVIVTSNGITGEGNSYVKNNVQMRALAWVKPEPSLAPAG